MMPDALPDQIFRQAAHAIGRVHDFGPGAAATWSDEEVLGVTILIGALGLPPLPHASLASIQDEADFRRGRRLARLRLSASRQELEAWRP